MIVVGGAELPYEVWLVARQIAKRTGQDTETVLNEWLGGTIERWANDPKRLEQVRLHALAKRRYCETEGLDEEEYSFRRCQATMRQSLKELRREWRGY